MHPSTRQHNSARRVGRTRQVAIMAASVGFIGAVAIVGTPRHMPRHHRRCGWACTTAPTTGPAGSRPSTPRTTAIAG